MISRRLKFAIASATLGASVIPLASAATTAEALPARPAPSTAAKHLVFLTRSRVIKDATINASGMVVSTKVLSPAKGTKKKYRPDYFLSSADGNYIAWDQFNAKDKSDIMILDLEDGQKYAVKTNREPLGFAGDSLICSFNQAYKLVLSPKPHFQKLSNVGPSLIGGVPGGVLDQTYSHHNKDGNLRITSFAGKNKTLAHYTDYGQPNYRAVDQSWTSPDGKVVAVERGNHQDFGGLGNSSLIDEFGLSKGYPRTQLGHYGDSSQVWRVADTAFAGPTDTPYAAWTAFNGANGIDAVVAEYTGGTWNTISQKAIDVAGDHAGDVAVQPGKYVQPTGKGADFPMAKPTASAYLVGEGVVVPLKGVKGTELMWASG